MESFSHYSEMRNFVWEEVKVAHVRANQLVVRGDQMIEVLQVIRMELPVRCH